MRITSERQSKAFCTLGFWGRFTHVWNGEHSILEIAEALDSGIAVQDITLYQRNRI